MKALVFVIVTLSAMLQIAYASNEGFKKIMEPAMMNNNQFDRITYSYGDSSTPDYVDYKIQATAESVLLTVSDFNGISESSFSFDSEKFSQLLAAFERHGVANCQRPTYDEPCAGGTTDSIICEQNNETVFSGGVYHCGGADTGDLCGDINAFVEDFKNLAPEIALELKKHGPGM